MEIVLVIFILFCFLAIFIDAGVRKQKEKQAKERIEKTMQEHYINNYGCSEEALMKKLNNSHVINKIATNVINRSNKPDWIYVTSDSVKLEWSNYTVENIYFRDFGIKSPHLSFQKEIAKALLVHLLSFYESKIEYDYAYNNGAPYLTKRPSSTRQTRVDLRGW